MPYNSYLDNRMNAARFGMVIGQEVLCPDGLGRVEVVTGDGDVYVQTYIHNRCCRWARHNVTLLDPGLPARMPR